MAQTGATGQAASTFITLFQAGQTLCYPRFWQIKRRGELRTGSESIQQQKRQQPIVVIVLLQQLKKAATLKNFQLVARAAAGSDAGFAVEGKVEIVNISQDGPAGNASLLRQLARRAWLLLQQIDNL